MSVPPTDENRRRKCIDEQFVEGWILKSKNGKINIMLIEVHRHFLTILVEDERDGGGRSRIDCRCFEEVRSQCSEMK